MVENQKGLWKFLSYRIDIPLKCVRYLRNASICLFAIFLVLGLYSCFGPINPSIETNKWLEFHRLAQLPKSVTNVLYYQWNGIFTGETYIRVGLSSNDLATFVTNSPGLSE